MKTRTITVNVTQRDIDRYLQELAVAWENVTQCAVERALSRKVAASIITVGHSVARIDEYRVALPDAASQFIRLLDIRKSGKPFSFTLEVPK